MVSLQVRQFCGCMSLKAGCIFIGSLSIILVLILTIITAVGIGALEAACAQHDCSEGGAAVTIARVFLGITMAICLLYLIFSAMLVHGARKDRAGLMSPWFYWTIVSAIFSIINIFTSGFSLILITRIAWIVLSIYFLIVVRSYQNELRGSAAAVPKA